MDSSDARQIVILLILLALSAFFSSAETCLTTVNKMRIKSLADDKNKNASLVLKLIEEKTTFCKTAGSPLEYQNMPLYRQVPALPVLYKIHG